MTTPLKPASLGPFLGLSNRRRAYELEDRERRGDFLARAENVDITNKGHVVRRKGFTDVIAGSDCHSLWADPNSRDAYFADGANLKRVREESGGLAVTTVYSSLTPGRLLSYSHDGIAPVYSDGAVLRRILATGVAPLVPPMLAAGPVLTPGSGGALPAGQYQACFTYLDADGREGGASPAQQVTVGESGKVTISNLPAAFPVDTAALAIYFSALNDGTLMKAATLYAPAATYTVSVLPTLGARCQTRRLLPLPAGTIVRQSNGRLFSVVGRVAFYSEPFMPGLHNPSSGYVLFPNDIATVETTASGIYFGTEDATYFAKGDIATADLKTVLPYGAIPRTGGRVPNKPECWWLSTRGVIVGDDDGNVKNRQEDEVRIDSALVGAAMFREQDGMKQFVVGTFGTRPTTAVAGSWAEAEVIHKEAL